MFGMIIVEPKGGLPPVDHEFVLVQSEWYLGEQGQASTAARPRPPPPPRTYVVWNGVANQYKDNPIQVPVGETVRVFVLNAGPHIDSLPCGWDDLRGRHQGRHSPAAWQRRQLGLAGG